MQDGKQLHHVNAVHAVIVSLTSLYFQRIFNPCAKTKLIIYTTVLLHVKKCYNLIKSTLLYVIYDRIYSRHC